MAYKHDIFVSYRRDPETLLWIKDFFKPIVTQRVRMELKREVNIYVHEVGGDQIQAGVAWPADLGETIACSRILIALWSGDYLASEWCQQELSLMLDRESKTKARTAVNKYGLVIPVIVHDGETIPAKLANAQKLEIKDYFISRMPASGPLAQELVIRIAKHAVGIAAAIDKAPRWRKEWPTKAAKKLVGAFAAQQKAQEKAKQKKRRKLVRFTPS